LQQPRAWSAHMVPQKRELKRCRKSKPRGKLGEVSCSREDCYCRGFVAAHKKIIKGVPLTKWVELLWDEGEAYDHEVIKSCVSGD